MNLLLHIVHVFIFTAINAYILFAANIEDFKTIAKKYIPAEFAEKLAQLAADTSLFNNPGEVKRAQNAPVNIMPQRQVHRTAQETQEDIQTVTAFTINQQYNKEIIPTERSHTKNLKKKIPVHEIDIDELVEKIKERLDKQYVEKYKTYINNKAVAQNKNVKGKSVTKKHHQNKHVEQVPQIQRDEVPQFEEVDMTKKNDSYEDYEVPPKEEKYSKEVHTPKSKLRNNFEKQTPKHNVEQKITKDDRAETKDYDYKIYKSSELKAKTENLNYDDHSYKMDSKTSKKVGSGIPTRERFSFSSPNYYVSVPVTAEKYDFNEPLPERDREPETVKFLGNPDAKINKKVRLL